MIFAIYAIVFAVFLGLSIKRPVLGVASIIALLPSYLWRFDFFSLPSTFLEIMIIAIFVVWLLKDKNYKRINFSLKSNQENSLPKIWRYLLSLWLLLSFVLWATNPSLAGLGLWRAYFLEPMMFFVVFIYSVKEKKDIKVIVNALAILSLWLLAVTLYQNFTDWNFLPAYNVPNVKRLTAVFSYPNALSLLTAPLFGFFISYFFYLKDKRNNYLYFLPALASLTMAFLAVSEGALLAIALAIIFYLILAKKTRKLALIILPALLVFSFIFLPVGPKVRQLSQELFKPELNLEASSLEIRSSQWQETWLMLKDNFIFGAGINNYQKVMENYHQSDWLEIYLYPHNIFLNFWSELGLLGLAVFLLIMFYVFCDLKVLFRKKDPLSWPLTLSWTIWFIHGLFDVPYFKNDLSILFFVFLGLTILATKKHIADFNNKN